MHSDSCLSTHLARHTRRINSSKDTDFYKQPKPNQEFERILYGPQSRHGWHYYLEHCHLDYQQRDTSIFCLNQNSRKFNADVYFMDCVVSNVLATSLVRVAAVSTGMADLLTIPADGDCGRGGV